jgi:DNA polymerase (family 10)
MTNRRIAEMLFNIATILEMAQDNVYRVRAYRRAARRILTLREEATAIMARNEPLPLPGVGLRIRRKLAELIASGSMGFYEELLDDLPTPVATLMAVEGIGPKTAGRLNQELGVGTIEDLLAAATAGKVHALYGFGARRESRLLHAARAATQAHVAA